MIATKMRSLLYKNINFRWSEDHKSEFDKGIASLSNLDKLEPYNPQNNMFALVDASLAGLALYCFKKTARGDLAFYRLALIL